MSEHPVRPGLGQGVATVAGVLLVGVVFRVVEQRIDVPGPLALAVWVFLVLALVGGVGHAVESRRKAASPEEDRGPLSVEVEAAEAAPVQVVKLLREVEPGLEAHVAIATLTRGERVTVIGLDDPGAHALVTRLVGLGARADVTDPESR